MEDSLITKEEGMEILKINMVIFRSNLIRITRERNISISELGERIDSNKRYMHYVLKTPGANPSYKKILLLAAALDVELSDLIKQ